MSIITPPETDQPEEPTNRAMPTHRLKEYYSRPYVRRILVMFIIIMAITCAMGWVVVGFMNMSGGPASDIMEALEQTVLVFTIASAPLIAITLSVIFYSLTGWKHSSGDEPPMQDSPAIRTNPVAVISWITATSLLAGFLVVWGLIELATITSSSYGSVSANQQPNSKKAIDINVTGQQWVWTFEYPGQEGITSPKLVVPIDTPLYFNVTSVDVIHNFWVVELGIKIDANPGAITNTGVTPNKLGTFNIRCAELCGMHHAYMETEIQVVTQEEFDSWVRDKGGKRTA
jgi:cytochrome c oxidase subunit 2